MHKLYMEAESQYQYIFSTKGTRVRKETAGLTVLFTISLMRNKSKLQTLRIILFLCSVLRIFKLKISCLSTVLLLLGVTKFISRSTSMTTLDKNLLKINCRRVSTRIRSLRQTNALRRIHIFQLLSLITLGSQDLMSTNL